MEFSRALDQTFIHLTILSPLVLGIGFLVAVSPLRPQEAHVPMSAFERTTTSTENPVGGAISIGSTTDTSFVFPPGTQNPNEEGISSPSSVSLGTKLLATIGYHCRRESSGWLCFKFNGRFCFTVIGRKPVTMFVRCNGMVDGGCKASRNTVCERV